MLADDTGIAACETSRWTVFNEYATGCHEASAADGHSRPEEGTGSDPTVALDRNSPCFERKACIIEVVRSGAQECFLGDADVVLDDDGRQAVKCYSFTDPDVVADVQAPWKMKSHSSTDDDTIADRCSEKT